MRLRAHLGISAPPVPALDTASVRGGVAGSRTRGFANLAVTSPRQQRVQHHRVVGAGRTGRRAILGIVRRARRRRLRLAPSPRREGLRRRRKRQPHPAHRVPIHLPRRTRPGCSSLPSPPVASSMPDPATARSSPAASPAASAAAARRRSRRSRPPPPAAAPGPPTPAPTRPRSAPAAHCPATARPTPGPGRAGRRALRGRSGLQARRLSAAPEWPARAARHRGRSPRCRRRSRPGGRHRSCLR